MDLHEQVAAAVREEMLRQAAEDLENLTVNEASEGLLNITGTVDLDALAAAVVGAVAGGP